MARNEFGLREFGTYIGEKRVSNLERIERFDYPQDSLETKIGMRSTSRCAPDETTSDMCVKAFESLSAKMGDALDPASIDLIVVVTQHPDGFGIPHTSAVVHGKIGMPKSCFAFDISLGCSGYVAALATVSGHLSASGGKRALLFTADPYSKSLDENDRNTAMIFGDAATVTLIEPNAEWRIGKFDFGTSSSAALKRDEEGVLRMDGRAVFNFCALNIPASVKRCLERNDVTKEQIDVFAMHPGSKYIVDTISKRVGITPPSVLNCADYGNTISSSVPLILADLDRSKSSTVLVSGFGVGLSWATCILFPE